MAPIAIPRVVPGRRPAGLDQHKAGVCRVEVDVAQDAVVAVAVIARAPDELDVLALDERADPDDSSMPERVLPPFLFEGIAISGESSTVQPGLDDQPDDEGRWPVTVAVDAERRNDAGVVFVLRSVTVTAAEIAADVRVTNGSESTIYLNNGHFRRGTIAVDDQGTRYGIVPPEGNSQIGVDAGEELEGRLSFSGRVPPDIRSVDILFNPDTEPDDSSMPGRVLPRFVFEDIALPPHAS